MPEAVALDAALAAVVESIGGQQRDGQLQMAEAVAAALSGSGHAIVQAGTGTGKSVGYLVPAALHAVAPEGGAVIVATVDGERVVGTLADAASKYPWWITPEGEWRAYGELADVSVVFGGVEF